LSTPLGTLTLEIQAPLPIGSRLTLALPAEAVPQPAGASWAPAALGTLAHTWPALEETLQTLREIGAPGAGAPAASEMVPRPGPRLTSGLLFFLAALGGDVGRWLGNQAMQALKSAGRETLLTRLGQDFGQLSRLAESPGGDWRLFFIPLLDGDQVQQLRLFLRHGQQGSGGSGGEEDDERIHAPRHRADLPRRQRRDRLRRKHRLPVLDRVVLHADRDARRYRLARRRGLKSPSISRDCLRSRDCIRA
jgi:hypothetical protein